MMGRGNDMMGRGNDMMGSGNDMMGGIVRTMNPTTSSKRRLLWIDGVGGYLICLRDEVLLGQPAEADIPIQADLSRRQATIRRAGETYVLTPIHRVAVQGHELTGPTVLDHNALIDLGESVRLRFRQPHPWSTSAVLALESHHKTAPAVDGIVLMSANCVLGPGPQSHIRCPSWSAEFVLHRRGEDLHFRTAMDVQLDGQAAVSSGVLGGTSRVESETVAMSFEEL